MNRSPSLLRRHRFMALAGIAVITAPMIAGGLVTIGSAYGAGVALEHPTPAGSLADIVAADKPAVVTITSRMAAQNISSDSETIPQPFKPNHHDSQNEVAEVLGSGFIISSDGLIVTNDHVVDGANEIRVILDDGKDYNATLVGEDSKSDLAVLKIDAGRQLATMSWGDSDKLRAGDSVLAIGNPFGIGTTVTSGIVSARGRDLHNGPYDDFIQVDAAINHGNSGGPLVDDTGKVIGINTAIYSPNGGNVGVGFAIPSNQAEAVVAKLKMGITIEHGYLGVQIQPVTRSVADAIGLKDAAGALIAKVTDGSPAARSGIKDGDVITMFGSEPVTSPHDLSRLTADATPGSSADVTVWRQGSLVKIPVTIGQNDTQKQASAEGTTGPASGSKLAVPTLGLGLTELTGGIRQKLGISPSVHGALVVEADENGNAADNGIEQGDVIVSVNQEKVDTAKAALSAIRTAAKDGRKSVLLQVERGKDQMFVGLPLNPS